MENKFQQRSDLINEATGEFVKNFSHLTEEQLNKKPSDTTWSIAQVMDHIITINKTYYPIISQSREGRLPLPFTARLKFMTKFYGSLILKSVQPATRRKTKTFPIWQPSQSKIDKDIIERFIKSQDELIALMKSCQDLIDKRTIIHSPANRMIVYSLDDAFEIITTHEKRHLKQALEIMRLIDK